ncbi:MAG: hypothetical protein A3C56_10145 [Ignavibacteria bacterium RIFCSPHIGHO2_02_FULL_56_12]|nr:MAG: hypothetical protein A3C56_10145 [Ignavibacteria bacterium RIFCSPHIGHO2_02_FULL_56_12]
MKHRHTAVACFFVALLLPISCNKSTEPEPAIGRAFTGDELRLVKSAESFGLKIFRTISAAEPSANQFISPLSISMALGMALNGAGGETFDSMKACLELNGMSEEDINTTYKSLMELLPNLDPKVAVTVANSAWYRNTFTVEPAFFEALTTWFGARVEGLDFSSSTAAPTINGWVSDATNGRITEIVRNPIPAEMVLYLINAVYFKGTWTTKFDPAKSYDGSFTLPNGSKKSVRYMTMNSEVLYGNVDGTQVLELPYSEEVYRMTLLLPPESMSIDAFVEALTATAWNEYVNALASIDIVIAVPKFRMEYERTLNDDLKALGMSNAFDAATCDLTRINPTADLFISEVKHKSFVQVDEEGTEAAAATSIGIGVTSAPQMVAFDRPFLFAIREARSGTILFIGKIVNPDW